MNRSRFFVISALVFAGTFAGGYAGSRGLPVVHAQMPGPSTIKGTSFTLVDARGNTVGALREGAGGAELILDDVNGSARVEIGATSGIIIRDARGKVTWSSPRTGVLPASE